ncbi:hypothetical protein, partial [Pseudomonas syringae]|uniref:hypothetical protein n=1 Tax=Pseudomonas syringae TaxID=317 RepID=UPI001CA984CF
RQSFSKLISYAYDMRSWFDAMVSKAPEGKEAKAKGYLDEMLKDWNYSIQSRDLAIDMTQAEYELTLSEIYNKAGWQVMNDLEAKNPEYKKFSLNGDPMSKAQVMQLYASAVQEDYQSQAEARGGVSQYMEVLT